MITLFSLIIICTIWVVGLKIATTEGMVLSSWGDYAAYQVEELGNRWFEPLLYCEWCMPSYHSIIAYLFGAGLGILEGFSLLKLLVMYPLVVMGASICAGTLWGLLLRMKSEVVHETTTYYERQIEN